MIERGGLHDGAEILQKLGVPPRQKSLDLGLRQQALDKAGSHDQDQHVVAIGDLKLLKSSLTDAISRSNQNPGIEV